MPDSISTTAQQEIREAFYDGAPGVLVSGLVWCTAAAVGYARAVDQGIWTLLIGGVFIHPLSVMLAKLLGRSGAPPKGNGLVAVAGASTVWLIVCCAMSYGLSLLSKVLFFPAMMATIGARYLIFATLYNRAAFAVGGMVLLLAGMAALFFGLAPFQAAALGGAIEIGLALALFRGAEAARGTSPAGNDEPLR